MPKQNQKLRLLYLREILLTQTDKNHLLTANEIIEILSEYGISAERKTIYDDIKALWESGVDVVMVKSKTCGYYVASRDFSPSEVKLLAEIVRESKIVTKKEAKRLIEKMQCLTSDYEWREIVRIPKRKSDITDS